MLEITAPGTREWDLFGRWADAEGWRVPPGELELYRSSPGGRAFVLKNDDELCGFVTLFAYRLSGWIGNLIVPSEYRGRGYGSRLFDHAAEVLRRRGVENIWLTASEMGRPLYSRRGFATVERIERWVLNNVGDGGEGNADSVDEEAFFRLDSRIWGESRRTLLAPLRRGGILLMQGGTGALLQAGNGVQILGPWLSEGLCPRENRQVLAAALAAARPRSTLVADVVAGSPVRFLLAAAGFVARGRTELMMQGADSALQVESLVALASLGSMG